MFTLTRTIIAHTLPRCPSEHEVEVKVLPVQSGSRRTAEEGGGGEEEPPPRKKGRVMLLQVKKKGKSHQTQLAILKLTVSQLNNLFEMIVRILHFICSSL